MTEPDVPDDFHVPSQATLLKATAWSLGVALVALTCFILPAEYSIDPTGFGRVAGIYGMADGDRDAGQDGSQRHVAADNDWRADVVNITVPAGGSLEYKFRLDEDATLVYGWEGTGPLFFDFHGEPSNDDTGYFESYEVNTKAEADGSLRAPFEGTHGWFWNNKGSTPVVVTLRTAGHYEVVGIL